MKFEHASRDELLEMVQHLTQQIERLQSQIGIDKQVQEASLTLNRQLLKQRSETLERTYEAVHNGPLQELAVLLRSGTDEPVRSQLEKISQDLRGIYQSMRLAMQDEALYLESGLSLDLDLSLDVLLQQVFEHTLERDFPGFETLQFQITPDFTPLSAAELSTEHKRGVCLFFQEALCNVGKHALGTTRLTVSCEKSVDRYRLRVADNGKPPSVIESLLQSLTESPEKAQQEKHQGTRQAKALAQQLQGKFLRRPNAPHGTICELFWPCPTETSKVESHEPNL
ncbi:MAG: hypothetical protein AAFR42_20675 [Cyanobacteria bacterium J06628_6]